MPAPPSLRALFSKNNNSSQKATQQICLQTC